MYLRGMPGHQAQKCGLGNRAAEKSSDTQGAHCNNHHKQHTYRRHLDLPSDARNRRYTNNAACAGKVPVGKVELAVGEGEFGAQRHKGGGEGAPHPDQHLGA